MSLKLPLASLMDGHKLFL